MYVQVRLHYFCFIATFRILHLNLIWFAVLLKSQKLIRWWARWSSVCWYPVWRLWWQHVPFWLLPKCTAREWGNPLNWSERAGPVSNNVISNNIQKVVVLPLMNYIFLLQVLTTHTLPWQSSNWSWKHR